MIDKVIICGVHRAKEKIPQREIQQEIGRAGRSYDKGGQAIIICNTSDIDYANSCLEQTTPPVKSEMNTVEQIAFHVLPWIDMVYDEDSFQKWFHKSLSFIQGNQYTWQEISEYLLKTNCIDEEYNITDFGKISIKMYYSPDKLIMMKNKLLEVNANGGQIDPISLSYILASEHIPMGDVNSYDLYEYKSQMTSNGYTFENGQLIQGFAYYGIFINKIEKWVKPIIFTLREDLPRLLNTLMMLAQYEGLKEMKNRISVLSISAFKKVSPEIAEIIENIGINKKSSAYELYDMGIYNKDDLKEREYDIIEQGSQSLKKDLQENGYFKDMLIKAWRMSNA